MDEQTINNLREALRFSPGNIPLKQHLAETLLKAGRLEEAETEYKELLSLSDDIKSKTGLAKVFYLQQQYSRCNVILEALIHAGASDAEVFVLHAKALLKENETAKAIESYQKALALNPGYTDEELDNELRVNTTIDYQEEEDTDYGSPFIQKPNINFDDVGGMTDIKKK